MALLLPSCCGSVVLAVGSAGDATAAVVAVSIAGGGVVVVVVTGGAMPGAAGMPSSAVDAATYDVLPSSSTGPKSSVTKT